MTGDRMRVAIVQLDTRPREVARNQDKIAEWCSQAVRQKVDFIQFHEVALTDYCEDVAELAEPVPGPCTKRIMELLRGTTLHVIVGIAERREDGIYNTAAIISGHGVVGVYSKTHLWHQPDDPKRDEVRYYRPGNDLPVFDLGGIRAGVMICFDGMFPEVSRTLALKGADLIFYLNNRTHIEEAQIRAIALMCGVDVIVSNRVGYSNEHYVYGNSMMVEHGGNILTKLWNREGMIIADLSTAETAKHKQSTQWITGRRPELYGALCVPDVSE